MLAQVQQIQGRLRPEYCVLIPGNASLCGGEWKAITACRTSCEHRSDELTKKGDTMSQKNDLRDTGSKERPVHNRLRAPSQSTASSRRSKQAVAATALRIAIGFWLCASVGYLAVAQNVAAAADSASTGLEEIVVTAQHVKENAQNTPIAMSVYGGEALKRDAITDIASLSTVAPDVNFANVQGEPIVTIRGISSRDTSANGDPAVTVNVDGFYQNREYSLNAILFDIDRIEVLRGPQGTLNGRNSVGGAINVVTAKPTNTFGAYASLEYGNYNELTTQGMVNVPINDELQIRAAFLSTSHDGYRNNAPQAHGD